MALWTVRAHRVSKKFGLTLRQSMIYGVRDAVRGLVGADVHRESLRAGEFWAVRDVSFEVKPGESLGIMGVNGSGKSTLLRILHGVFPPDTGKAQLRGRVGALIAAGAGFSPLLTGRENVFLNGSLLGMSQRALRQQLDMIVDFAGLAEFIDMPVKHYSSGMMVRLGFAIAAMSEPEILLVDEVLAVGDLNFQKKCYDYLIRLKRQGSSIVLVSHAPGAIWSICDRGLFMHRGIAETAGSVEEVVRAYDQMNAALASESLQSISAELPADYRGHRGGTGEAYIHAMKTLSVATGQPRDRFEYGEPIMLEADVEIRAPIDKPLFRCTIDAMHYRFIASIDSHEQGMDLTHIVPGRYLWRSIMKRPNLMPGAYRLNANVTKRHFGAHIFFWNGIASFTVKHPTDRFLYSEPSAVLFLETQMSLVEHLREAAVASN
jgi:lipopolysaccharide transport system ATP-binding protein